MLGRVCRVERAVSPVHSYLDVLNDVERYFLDRIWHVFGERLATLLSALNTAIAQSSPIALVEPAADTGSAFGNTRSLVLQ